MDTPTYYIFILTNDAHSVLHVGQTEDLLQTVMAHRLGHASDFTRRFEAGRLVYVETHDSAQRAAHRMVELKAASSRAKVNLIHDANPEWRDVLSDWGARRNTDPS